MDDHTVPTQTSRIERQWRRLVVPAPADYAPSERIDFIHDPNLNDLFDTQPD